MADEDKKQRLGDIVYRAPSKIHGHGLFAKVVIGKGEFIGTYGGPEAKRDGTYVLWVFEEGKPPVGRSGRNLLRYLNHHETGNAEFDGFDLYALRKIKPHEEITFNYGTWDEA
jgi:SET domain-containing protein